MSVRPVVQVIQTRATAGVSQPRSVVVKVPGPQGPKGDTGADSTVPGPTGPQGPQGIQGIQGVQGEKGDKGDTGDGVPTPVGTDGQVVTAASGVAVWDDPAVQSVNGATGVVTLDTDDVAESTVNKYVRIFADSSARNTALPSPIEGLITYLEDTNAVEVNNGSAWTQVGSDPNPGIGTNVVQTVKTDTFSTTSATFTAVTGLSASITPSNATSKVLVSAVISYSSSVNTGQAQFNLMRGATAIAQPSGGTNPATAHVVVGNANSNQTVKIMFLDSPASASSVTYSIDIKALGGTTSYVNQTGGSANDTTVSSITLVEVAV